MPHHDSHDANPLGSEEKAILLVFGDLGVPAGESVPSDVILARIGGGAGNLPSSQPWQWESAYVGLMARGLIEPGEDPFSAFTWTLTPDGYEFVHATDGTGLDAA